MVYGDVKKTENNRQKMKRFHLFLHYADRMNEKSTN
jgi:hypothetical protein